MNPLRHKVSSLGLLPNEQQEPSQQNDEISERNEAEISASGVNTRRQFKSPNANSMAARTLHQHRLKSSQAGREDCCGNNVFLLSVIVIGICSTAASGFVLYLLDSEESKCQCSPSSAKRVTQPGHAIGQEKFPGVLNNLNTQLEKEIRDLRGKMDNFSRNLNENQCNGDGKNCGGKSVDGFLAKYQEIEETLKRQYNLTEERIKGRFEETNRKVQAIADEKPNCLLKQAKKSENSTLVTVHVPKSSEDHVTVGVTCTTTLQNTADVRYMMASSEGEGDFICYCKNSIRKQIDCVAYFWQCKTIR